jgi:urease accessory protein
MFDGGTWQMGAMMVRIAGAAVVAIGAAVLLPGAAEAHTFGLPHSHFTAGLTHPLGGLDHLLAMVAVGLWAAQLGGRALWAVPAAFVAMMVAGGIAGMTGVALPLVELGIVGSLLVLGALIMGWAKLPVWASAALVGFFALFHGHAHGAEMPADGSALGYAAGFVLATALLHGIGLAAGLYVQKGLAPWLVRLGGAGVAAAGLVLLVG